MRRNTGPGSEPTIPPVSDVLPIAVRTYGVQAGKKPRTWNFPSLGPSRWSLIFDTETTTDESQRLRIGTYQLREGNRLREQGLFYDAEALNQRDRKVLERYATIKGLKLLSLTEFVKTVLVRVGFQWKATTIGFNLPFDLSRIAERHGPARGKMRPGFSFEVAAPGVIRPRVRIKHLSRRASLVEFSARGLPLPRGQRRRKVGGRTRKPAFVDVSTLAAALLSRTFSLGELSKYLGTPHQKLDPDGHGHALTPKYLDYAMRDVQVTWECYVELCHRYKEHGLRRTPIHRILSEASIGKGYLREMGIRPWREMHPPFPPDLIGKLMGTYYGGRTEVHQRRVVTQVLYCDFTSMYPTVSALMGLWPYVIAKGVKWHDATAETRRFLDDATLADLQHPKTWRRLHTIVQVAPEGDILPVRAKYGYEPVPSDQASEKHYTIGLNHLTSSQPLCFTLADCVASKLLLGRPPKILKAIAFEPRKPQDNLKPVAIAGNPEFTVDPLKEDFFKRIIELRMTTQGPERNALKLIANATGYGIFVQLDVVERHDPVAVQCYPASGRQFLVDMDKVEEPGEFFHPLLGTLITGAARLMLAVAERLVDDAGLTWAFCDTDSMAIARPEKMDQREFYRRAEEVRNWFKPLNPYATDVELFKIEDANFRIQDGKLSKNLEPLYCFAISSKRYVMFNINERGEPVIRKATAHGLGHLLSPYPQQDAPTDIPAPAIDLREIGVTRWQHDLWWCIARAALAGTPERVDFAALPNFDQPAVTKYAATTAHLLKWFNAYNGDKPYAQQVRPFNFMMMFQADPLADWYGWRLENGIEPDSESGPPCVVAPYDDDPGKAARRCFDRDTGKPIPTMMLRSYAQALAQYHLRPEPKFLNANYINTGTVQRRHIKVSSIRYIGKEANRWEEQSYLGVDPQAEIAYGTAPSDKKSELRRLQETADRHGAGKLAKTAGISRQQLHAILSGYANPTDATQERLARAAMTLELEEEADSDEAKNLFARIKEIGIRKCATLAGIDAGHLTRIISGKRKLTKAMLETLNPAVQISS